jgi:hypothetical protein
VIVMMSVADVEVPAAGSGCTKKVARNTRSLVTTIWRSTSTNTSPRPISPEILTRPYSRRQPERPASSPARPCGSRTPTA